MAHGLAVCCGIDDFSFRFRSEPREPRSGGGSSPLAKLSVTPGFQQEYMNAPEMSQAVSETRERDMGVPSIPTTLEVSPVLGTSTSTEMELDPAADSGMPSDSLGSRDSL